MRSEPIARLMEDVDPAEGAHFFAPPWPASVAAARRGIVALTRSLSPVAGTRTADLPDVDEVPRHDNDNDLLMANASQGAFIYRVEFT